MESIDDWLREPARGMSPGAVLAQPLMHLQGVSATAEATLGEAGIHTVLDLAASALFGVAPRFLKPRKVSALWAGWRPCLPTFWTTKPARLLPPRSNA